MAAGQIAGAGHFPGQNAAGGEGVFRWGGWAGHGVLFRAHLVAASVLVSLYHPFAGQANGEGEVESFGAAGKAAAAQRKNPKTTLFGFFPLIPARTAG